MGGFAADVVAIDVLARLQLASRRHGFELRIVNATVELQELLDFAGLRDVLRVEAGREPE